MTTLRFRSTGGMLAFAGAVLVLGAYAVCRTARGDSAVDDLAAPKAAIVTPAQRAACVRAIAQIAARAFPTGIDALPEAPIELGIAAREVPFITLRSPSGLELPPPRTVAKHACAHALDVPPIVGVTSYRCAGRLCVGTLAWLRTGDLRVLGVARATVPMRHLGYDEDGEALSREFDRVLAATQ